MLELINSVGYNDMSKTSSKYHDSECPIVKGLWKPTKVEGVDLIKQIQ